MSLGGGRKKEGNKAAGIPFDLEEQLKRMYCLTYMPELSCGSSAITSWHISGYLT